MREARAGETLTTLDGKARTLAAGTLVIADAAGPVAIGGVMGGADSEVRAGSTRIVFESAWFKPQSVRATSKALGLRSEASIRFERGADPTMQAAGMARACALLEITGAGRADGPIVDVQATPHVPRGLAVSHAHIEALLGMPVPPPEVERILVSLGCGLAAASGAPAWRVTVPGWRPDIVRAEDVIEEVGRHHGFEHLPATFPPVSQAPPPSDPRIARDARVRKVMLGMGFSEAISFAFIEASAATPFAGGAPLITLANPLSETFAVMRPSVLPGVIDAVSHNRRHGRRDVRLFEIATAFAGDGERRSLAAAWTGAAAGDHWSGGRREVDFFDMKGVVEQACAGLGVTPAFAVATRDYLVAGRAAEVAAGGRVAGVVGLLSPALADARGIPKGDGVFVLELDLAVVAAAAATTTMRVEPLPRYPAVVRDVSLLVDDTLSASTVRDTIRQAAPPSLVSIREFDRYQGSGVPPGKVSVSLRLTFRADDRTLTDDDVQAAMHGIVAAVRDGLGAEQR